MLLLVAVWGNSKTMSSPAASGPAARVTTTNGIGEAQLGRLGEASLPEPPPR